MKLCIHCSREVPTTARFCAYCGHVQGDRMICPKCRYANEGNSKFCQECAYGFFADPQESSTHSQPTTELSASVKSDTDEIITIEFVHSTAANFDFAVDEARKLPTFEQTGEGKKARYKVSASAREIERLHPVVENLQGLRNKIVFLNGTRQKWENIFHYTQCYDDRQSSYNPTQYCFGYDVEWHRNLFGCINSDLFIDDRSKWWTWGKWLSRDGQWGFDLNRIRHELEKNLYKFKYCPALNLTFVEAVLDVLPKVVNPFTDSNWKPVETWDKNMGSALAVNVKNDWGSIETRYYIGAAPRSRKAIETIISNARKKLVK